MKLYGHAESCANRIIEAFRSGRIPEALARVFIKRNDATPCRAWSWSNQLLTALAGYDDARGFRQWLDVGRAVKKGEKAFYILAPIAKPIKETSDDGQERQRVAILGFRSVPVFGLEQTDIADESVWSKHAELDRKAERFIDELPLIGVARSWGLTVKSYAGRERGTAGWYSRSRGAIAIGVENLSTWSHELIHASDDRLGNLVERGQHWMSETVAELGGAVLLYAAGYEREADIGGAWDYISHYATENNVEPIKACSIALERVCKAVALILETSETLSAAGQGVAA
jgi:antirestriction factor ArdC-like protein